jgi:RHS repeat-associated protein
MKKIHIFAPQSHSNQSVCDVGKMASHSFVTRHCEAVQRHVHNYYPYGGVIGDISTNENVQKYKFEGKELDRTFGLDNYDIHSRQYFAMMPSWDKIDPMAEKYYGISPYAYCGGDPVNFVDLTGCSTQVVMIDSTRYMVVDGNLEDNDRNIYVVAWNDEGELERTGQVIGESATIYSFYNSDTKSWEQGSVIDLSDNSSDSNMEKIQNENENLITYMGKAMNGQEYDFKQYGDPYRGMPAPFMGGQTTIASARDIGNYGAGYKAGMKGLSPIITFLGFTLYDCKQNGRIGIEPKGSRVPQWIGYKNGIKQYIKKSLGL